MYVGQYSPTPHVGKKHPSQGRNFLPSQPQILIHFMNLLYKYSYMNQIFKSVIQLKNLIQNIQRNFVKLSVERKEFDRFWIAVYNIYKFQRIVQLKLFEIDFI